MFNIRLEVIIYLIIFCQDSDQFESISGKDFASLPVLFHFDNYDDCMLLEDKALFCSITYQIYPSDTLLGIKLKEIIASPYNYRRDILRHGICVPVTCPTVTSTSDNHLYEEITKCYNEKYQPLGLSGNISKINCDTVDPKYPIDLIDIIFGSLLIFYLLFVLFATFYEKLVASPHNNENQKINTWKKILFAFSIHLNWIRLKTVNTDSDTKKLCCIQGVRFYNMVLVILVHTIMTLFLTLPILNTRSTETLTERLSTVFLASGPLCVSTFFLISSWLLTSGIFETFKDNKIINWKIIFIIFINRYIRLTPSLALVIAFQATWLRHLGTGPNWNSVVDEEYVRCRKNWWANIFYINNYIDPENMCMQTTWHLALDTQYFAILLLLLWFIKRIPKSIWIIFATLLTISICVSFFENYINDFPALIAPTPESLYGMNHTLKNKQWHIQYIGFFGNMAGPIIGLYVGYAYVRYKDRNIFTKKIHVWLWHILILSCCLGTILITGLLSLPEDATHNIFWASVHVAISRPVFAFGVGAFLFGMSQGIGGIVKHICEWRPLYVLGRLTYSAYLVHIPLLLLRGGMIRSPVYFNEYSVFFELMGHLTVSYLVAMVFTLLFEMPVSALQKIFIRRQSKGSVKRKKCS